MIIALALLMLEDVGYLKQEKEKERLEKEVRKRRESKVKFRNNGYRPRQRRQNLDHTQVRVWTLNLCPK